MFIDLNRTSRNIASSSQVTARTPFKSWTALQQSTRGNNVVSQQWPTSSYEVGSRWMMMMGVSPHSLHCFIRVAVICLLQPKSQGTKLRPVSCARKQIHLPLWAPCLPPPSPLITASASTHIPELCKKLVQYSLNRGINALCWWTPLNRTRNKELSSSTF